MPDVTKPEPTESRRPGSRLDRWPQIVATILLVLLAASVVFSAIRLGLAPTVSDDPDVRIKSDYVLMILQCLLGIGVIFLPAWTQRRFSVKMPSGMELAFLLFLFGAIYLGEVRGFYFRIPYWDTILHAFSGGMLGALGFSLVVLMNDSRRLHIELSPFFVSFFAFCFAVTAGTVWEIYEFAADAVLGTNMQKFMTDTGEVLVGHAALSDTMKDLIVDSLAALLVVTVGHFSLRRSLASSAEPRLLDRDQFRVQRDD